VAAMKSNAPWSVKGIERDARETAKDAAKREGMTVGEWLNQMIYTAGAPEETDGNIEGLKVRDLVTAIDHLNKRLGEAGDASADAIGDLTRNVGKVVERVQRLERVKPAEGSSDDVVLRLEKLEESSSDRQRIEALKALEKAVAQVAVQFNTAHKTSLERISSNEKQLQELARRIDNGAGNDGDGDISAIGFLKDAIDGLSTRITRAERIASEAAKLKGDVSGSADPDFVERTSARLRVLGEEIKRGGDHNQMLEATIGKLSNQIDAAERRSSEGVQKIAGTITELRDRFAGADAQDNGRQRAEIQAAVADASRQTEDRISALQNSFDDMISRLEALDADEAVANLDDDGEAEPGEEIALTVEFDGGASDGAASGNGAADIQTGAGADDDFSFDLDDDEGLPPQKEAESLLSEVQDAFSRKGPVEDAGEAGPTGGDAPLQTSETPAADDDDLNAILADLDNITGGETQTAASGDSLPPGAATPAMSAAPPPKIETDTADKTGKPEDYLKAARRTAKEAAQRAASEEKLTRRKLTPKQKAILAARARRKRLEAMREENTAEKKPAAGDGKTAAAMSAAADAPAEATPEAKEESKSSPFAAISGAFAGLRERFSRGAKASETDNDADKAQPYTDEGENDDAGNESRAAFANLKSTASARPVTLALGVAIFLAVGTLFFLVKDLVFKSPDTISQPPIASSPAANDMDQQTAAPSLRGEDAPQVPAPPTVNPRNLYMEAMTALNAAGGDEETASAISKLNEAAALGHPPAQLQLGELYKLGQGVEQDLGQARTWFRRAANGGNVLAMHRIGVMTARGDGGLADTNEAIGWFELAANRALVDSQYNLGAIYHPSSDGSSGAIHDAGKAYYWYSLAAKNGDEQAAPLAAGVSASLTAPQRQEIDNQVAAWTAEPSDPVSNELASGS